MAPKLEKILGRVKTRAGAGTVTLSCGHQIAVTGAEWSKKRASMPCPECARNAELEKA